MNLTYRFLGYVANNAGIKFGLQTDVKQTIRFDHKLSTAPGSTKTDPIPFIRNSIAYSGSANVKTCAADMCGKNVPVTASVNWSGPQSQPEALVNAIDQVIAALNVVKTDLNLGFLPTTSDIELTIGE